MTAHESFSTKLDRMSLTQLHNELLLQEMIQPHVCDKCREDSRQKVNMLLDAIDYVKYNPYDPE
jgi:hypothetical protein